jgi:hypothetical protein
VTFFRYALRVLGGLVGTVFTLHSTALVLLGMEEVGGPTVVIPAALGLSAAGVLAISLALRKRKDAAA